MPLKCYAHINKGDYITTEYILVSNIQRFIIQTVYIFTAI